MLLYMRVTLCLTVLVLSATLGFGASAAPDPIEALHRVIMIRADAGRTSDGTGETDPLLWDNSTYFVSGTSRTRLQAALDAVNRLSDDDISASSPAKRALVQNRLWAVFDYLNGKLFSPRTAISAPGQAYLAAITQAMARLALTEAEIAALPDPLAEAERSDHWSAVPTPAGGPEVFLPAGLEANGGRWTLLGREKAEPSALFHVQFTGGRTTFLLLARFPDPTLSPEEYFKAASSIGGQTPDLPKGAEFALVRNLMVIDRSGRIRATPLTLSVQIRHYWSNAAAPFNPTGQPHQVTLRGVQSVAEFRLDTEALAAGQAPRLRTVGPDEMFYLLLNNMGVDRVVVNSANNGKDDLITLESCVVCHGQPSRASIGTLSGMGGGDRKRVAGSATTEAERTSAWKTGRAEWKKLNSLWPRL